MGQALPPRDALGWLTNWTDETLMEWDEMEKRAEVLALGLRDDPPATVGSVDGARGALLDVLLLRARFIARIEEELAGFPPEVVALATAKAAESGAEEVLRSIAAVGGIYDMTREPGAARAVRMRRAFALGLLLGMDPKEPNMRIWAGEDPAVVFGLG